ncbi:MAG: hypothetical protein KAW09_01865, partial [Thermoplasmata archaeon]|nr:hypothetical protein [Thermoplasmata archaeon]
MDKTPEPQEQPVYPQQYQQPYPYYYPYPPPKKDDKTLIIVIVVIVIILVLVPVILSFILYWTVIDLAPNGVSVPTGVWGTKTVISNTEVRVDFGKVSSEPRPMDLEIILVRNYTREGKYVFATNSDGALIWASGTDVADLTYADLADNERVNTGDQLRITSLSPNSDYTLRMIWGPTGDQITATTFYT